MNSPKLLPWYARKAGVSLERAEALWRKAVREATAETGWVGTPEYWGAAEERFRSLLERESASLCAPRVTPLLRKQNRLWSMPFHAMEDVALATARNWQQFLQNSRRVA